MLERDGAVVCGRGLVVSAEIGEAVPPLDMRRGTLRLKIQDAVVAPDDHAGTAEFRQGAASDVVGVGARGIQFHDSFVVRQRLLVAIQVRQSLPTV